MKEKALEHIGHEVELAYYGDGADPVSVTLECLDCGCVVIAFEDYED